MEVIRKKVIEQKLILFYKFSLCWWKKPFHWWLGLAALILLLHESRVLFKSLYWKLYRVHPTWDWSQHFPLTSNTTFTRTGASVHIPPGPTMCIDPSAFARGKQHTGDYWEYLVFVWLAQLKRSPRDKAEGCLCGWKSQKHLIEGEKAVPWLSIALYCRLHTQYGSTSHPFRVVKITGQGTGEPQLGGL